MLFPPAVLQPYPRPHKSSSVDGALPMSLEWFDGLPPSVRPINLIEQYPRIVNLIALEWNNPAIVGTLVTGLLNDDPGGQDGFPAAVLLELRALHAHYFKAALAEQVIFREFEAIAAGESWDWGPANNRATCPAPTT